MSLVDPARSETADPSPVIPPQSRRLCFLHPAGQVARGREFTRRVLRELELGGRPAALDPGLVDDVVLAVSELLSNAVQHAGGVLELVVTANPGRLRVEVLDASGQRPVLRSEEPTRPGGHGLRVVSRLASRWGATDVGDGKAVWAELDLPPLG